MTIVDAFAGYLVTLGIGTLGTDMFIGSAPSSDHAPDAVAWLRINGGAPTSRLLTGEQVKSYQVQVYFRDRSTQSVYQSLLSLEETLNGTRRIPLEGFDVYSVSADTFPVDDDLDDEDRKVGLLQATLVIYKEQIQ
jgi:hypothetical protein